MSKLGSFFITGIGAYSLLGTEISQTPGHSRKFSIFPYAHFRLEAPVGARWYFSPRLGVFYPRSERDGVSNFSGTVEFDAGIQVGSRWRFYVGPGLYAVFQRSSFQEWDLHGRYVSPSRDSLAILSTANLGVSHSVDSRFRFDLAVSSLMIRSEWFQYPRLSIELGYVL